MRSPYIVIDGRRYCWRDLLALRREQSLRPSTAEQLTLFELRDDARPSPFRTASGRYREPGLFDV